MTGFQIFLCVIAGIVLFLIAVLSIPLHVSFTYTDKIYLSVRYLFLKLDILPLGEKKEKAKKEEKPKEDKPEKEPKEKKPSPILDMIKANGYDGMMLVLSNLNKVLTTFFLRMFKSVVFEKIFIYMTVTGYDAAETAIKYGKTCQKVFPVMGLICSNNLVKSYDVNVEPDFLANTGVGEMTFEFYVVFRKIINALIAMVFGLIFKVGLKFINAAKKNKSDSPQTKQSADETQQ